MGIWIGPEMSDSSGGSSLRRNFAYTVAYQGLMIVLPFVTAPYLSRVLGVEGVGIYSYSYAVATYFLMFATLGMANHGNRSVAATAHDKRALGKTFVDNYVIQMVCAVFAFGLYLTYCFFSRTNQLVALIQGVLVLSGALDINWFFFGIEEFKLTVTRNAVCKILSVVAMFAFVRQPGDLWIYALIVALSVFSSQAILWAFLPSRIVVVRPCWRRVRANIKPVLVLFVPILSYSIYMVLDKIQIGQLADMSNVAYYANAEKIVGVPVGIVTALSTVMLPRATTLVARGDNVGHVRNIVRSFTFVSIVVGFVCLGISSVATLFAPLYFGEEFSESGQILQFLILAPLVSAWANVIRTQYLIPRFMDGVYVVSTIVAAIINFSLNMLLIPVFQARGAVIGTLLAESSVLIIQALAVRRQLPWREIVSTSLPYLVNALTVFGVVKGLLSVMSFTPFVQLCVAVLVGTFVYICLSLGVAFARRDDVYGMIRRRIR